MSKCRVCRGPAVIDLPRHNANFCAEHLQQLCRRQVEKAIADHDMLRPDDRVLVAVSGGKDSLAVWDLLTELGYRADGAVRRPGHRRLQRRQRPVRLGVRRRAWAAAAHHRPAPEHGYDVPTASRATGRVPCSACGLSKRHLFDAAAREGGYDVVVTGHNLDDEAAVLLGNTMRWDIDYLARQLPVLPASDGFPRKVKPLVRLTERETAAWCIVRGIDYQVEECPMAAGNRHLGYKAALNDLERTSPGTKAAFYLGFVERMAPLLAGRSRADVEGLVRCSRCGVADDRRGLRLLPARRDGVGARARADRDAHALPVVAGERAARGWGSGCCSSTPSGGATSSCWPRAGSSTATPASWPTATWSGNRRAPSCARRRAPSTPCCARRSRTSCWRCLVARR